MSRRDDRPLVLLIGVLALLALWSCGDARAQDYRGGAFDGTTFRGGMEGGGEFFGEVPPGVLLWFDSRDTATITEASAAVSAWKSKVGGTTFAQASAGAKPTLVAAGSGTLNGAQHLAFDGGDFLSIDSQVCSGASGEVWAVLEVDNASTTTQTVYCEANNSTTVYVPFYAVGGVSAKPGLAVSATTDVLRTTNSIVADTPTLLRWASSGTATSIELQGAAETVVVVAGANDGDWFADAGAIQRAAIGAYYHNTTTQFLVGQITQVLVVDGAVLPTSHATAIRRVFAAIYGVTLP